MILSLYQRERFVSTGSMTKGKTTVLLILEPVRIPVSLSVIPCVYGGNIMDNRPILTLLQFLRWQMAVVVMDIEFVYGN